MALVLKDRVKVTSTTTGTGTFTLGPAATGYDDFSVIGDGNTTYYTIALAADWEVGIGTYTASGTTLSRDTVLSSSNSGSLVNFGSGTKDVFVTYPAGKSVVLPDIITYTLKTANYTALVNDGVIADTSGGSFTVTLPASPSTGNQVIIVDGDDWSTNNLTVARNGSTIVGVAEDLTCDVEGISIQFLYDGTTWQVYALAIGSGADALTSADIGVTVGYPNIPAVGTKTSSYTLATGDVGKYVQVGTGGSITIPNSTFSEGDAITIFNNTTGDVTITCSITTAYIAGTDTDVASVTLATRGLATILFISGTVCAISGNVS